MVHCLRLRINGLEPRCLSGLSRGRGRRRVCFRGRLGFLCFALSVFRCGLGGLGGLLQCNGLFTLGLRLSLCLQGSVCSLDGLLTVHLRLRLNGLRSPLGLESIVPVLQGYGAFGECLIALFLCGCLGGQGLRAGLLCVRLCFLRIRLCLPCLLALCLSLIPIRDGRFASQFRIVAGLLSEFLLGLGGFLCLLGGSDVRGGLGDCNRSRGFGGFHRSRSLCGLLVCISHLRFRALNHSHCGFALCLRICQLERRLRLPLCQLRLSLRYPAGHSGFEEGLEVVGEPTLVERSADVEVCRRVQEAVIEELGDGDPARGQDHAAAVDLWGLLVVVTELASTYGVPVRDEKPGSRGILSSLVRAPVVRHNDVCVGEVRLKPLGGRGQGRPGGYGCR